MKQINRREALKGTGGFIALGFLARLGALFTVGIAATMMKACATNVLDWTAGISAAVKAAVAILSPEAAYASLVKRLNELLVVVQDFETAFKDGVPVTIAEKFDLLSRTFETLANDLGLIKSVSLRVAVEAAIAGVSIFLHQIAGHIVTVVVATPGGPARVQAAMRTSSIDSAHVETIKRVATTEPWGKTFKH